MPATGRVRGGQAVLLYILFVAAVNLGLGYAAALYFGFAAHGPADPPARRAVVADLRPTADVADELTDSSRSEPPADAGPAVPATEPSAESPAETDRPVTVEEAVETEEDDEAGNPPGPVRDATDAATPVGEPAAPDQPTGEDREKSAVEEAVDAVDGSVSQFREQLAGADEQIRVAIESRDASALARHVDQLLEETRQFVAGTKPWADVLWEQHANPGGIGATVEMMRQAIVAHHDKLTDASGRLQSVDTEAELEGRSRELVSGVAEMDAACTQLRDHLAAGRIEMARQERGQDESSDRATSDDTGKGNGAEPTTRDVLEAELERFWAQDPDRTASLTLAMIDLDHTQERSETCGLRASDRLRLAIGNQMSAVVGQDGLAAHFAGEKFVVMFAHATPRQSVSKIERVRQTIEQTRFQYGDAVMEVTASCAAVACTPDDTLQTILTRLEETLLEAKRYGRNRTFLHEGKYPAPVVPPNLDIVQEELVV